MGHRIQDLTQRLDTAVPLLEHELDRRLRQLLMSVYASAATRDGMERVIDELDDDAARRELRRLLRSRIGRCPSRQPP
jgi:hypothetical protein